MTHHHALNLLLPTHHHHCRPGDRTHTAIEEHLLSRLGGPWTGPDPSGAALRWARHLRDRLQEALGYGLLSDNRWLTTDTAKQRATVANAGATAMAGVSVLSARGAAAAWNSLDAGTRTSLADALGVDAATIVRWLRLTVCPHATPGCTSGCVMNQGQAKLGRNELTQLVRTLVMLIDPEAFLGFTYDRLWALAGRHGAHNVRWRTNMADDIRWERIAPGMFSLGIPAVAYTKFPPCCRPERLDLGLRIVYSASERWCDDDIVAVCAAGHTVAIVFDVPKGQLPASHLGIEVVDGDTHDDHHLRPHGVIVGLTAKGNTNETRVALRTARFSREPSPS